MNESQFFQIYNFDLPVLGLWGFDIVVKEKERQTRGIRGEQEQAEAEERLVGRVGHERGRGKWRLESTECPRTGREVEPYF